MNAVALSLIFLPLVLAVYSYVAYPMTLWFVSDRVSRPEPSVPEHWPIVTIVIPAYNEESQIRGAIEALLAQDYPADRRQILILSDASSDGTDAIVREYVAQGVELLRMPARSGKTAAENASIPFLRGEIVVNSDASIRLHRAAVRRLVEQMADPHVGVASGRDVSVSVQQGANAAEAGYVGYEMWLRSLETRTGGIVGASGSGYAIRAELHKIPIREDLSRDFSAALTARTHGFRAVSVDDALCAVPRNTSLHREYRRKVRTISRGIETLWFQRHLMNPFRYGMFSWKLISHKVCRWLLPVAAAPGLLGLCMLAATAVWARMLFFPILLLSVLAVVGFQWPDTRPMPRWISVVAFGIAANLAVVHAVWRFARGKHDHIWEPTRRATGTVANG